jgi:hypothetical protein
MVSGNLNSPSMGGVVDDGYCDGSRHLVSLDHSPKPIQSVVRLQVAGGNIGQCRKNDRKVIHGVRRCNPPVWQNARFLEFTTNSAGMDHMLRRRVCFLMAGD